MSSVVGYIGLGDIGAPMAERIIDSGYELVVWDKAPSKLEPLIAKGAIAAKSAADLATRVDIVFLCVDSAAAVEDIVFGPAGLTTSGCRAKLVVDSSTLDPQRTREIATRAKEEADIRWLDAPVSGGSGGARAGTLAVMVGGDAVDVEIARPVILTYAGQLTHMGDVGAGMATKICNQILIFGAIMAIGETTALASKFGIDVERLTEAVAGGYGDSPILREYARATRAGEDDSISWYINKMISFINGHIDHDSSRDVGLSLKDSSIAIELGHANGLPMLLSSAFYNAYCILHNQS